MNTNRLIQVLKWNIIGTKKELLRQTLLIFGAFCIILAMQNINHWLHGEADYWSVASSASTMLAGVGFAMVFWASKIAFNIKTKTEFVNYVMLPATKGEKFMANFIYQTLLRIALVIIGMVAADVLQMVISMISAGDAFSMSLIMVKNIQQSLIQINDVTGSPIFEFDTLAVLLLIHASYVFGGTFFRKHQFLYTTLFWIFGPMLIGTAVAGSGVGLIALVNEMGYTVKLTWLLGETASVVLITVIILAMAFGLYFLAYRYFSRSQIINNKFIN